ncbi:MAG: TIGR02452 family protein [Krumholzibacteria bacterium]|nr:TIGR02452 family protein [Candidatus Krumholzibacteria bacterium]
MILDRGWYDTASGRVSIAEAQRSAVGETVLFRPGQSLESRRAKMAGMRTTRKTEYSVSHETTQEAALRMAHIEGIKDLAVLNFASARNVAGGFLRGANSQEEDVARSSGLYRCLETQPGFYSENQACSTCLYTDNIIYSPQVPWFRSAGGRLLERPFLASIVTSPAPNAKEFLERGGDRKVLREVLARRAAYILEVAVFMGHKSLLLGAWGCGVFRNDAVEVADVFMSLLRSRQFRCRFEQVVFAVHDPSKSKEIYNAFRSRVA